MDSLARSKSGRATFVETKHIALLTRPVESSGELLYTAPDRLEKRTLKPKPEAMTVQGGELTIERAPRNITCSCRPTRNWRLSSTASGHAAGDRKALERSYRVSLSGSADGWTLQLLPLDEKMQAVIQRIRIAGTRDQVNSIEITQSDGDSSFMAIEKSTPPP